MIKKRKLKGGKGTRKKAARRIKAHIAESSDMSRTTKPSFMDYTFGTCNIIKIVQSIRH